MIKDNEIENIIRNNEHDMDSCTDCLIQAACDAEGSDNITICTAQILQGAKECDPFVFEQYDRRISGPAKKMGVTNTVISSSSKPKMLFRRILIGFVTICIVTLVAFSAWKIHNNGKTASTEEKTDTIKTDSIADTVIRSDFHGNVLTIKRTEGVPMVGDEASPDGIYTMEGDTVIEVRDGRIYSITKESEKQEANIEEKEHNKQKSSGGKKRVNKILDSNPPKKEERSSDSDNKNGDSLTHILSGSNANSTITTHKVQQKETLYSISRKYNVTEDDIKKNNKKVNFEPLQVGTVLHIPQDKVK